MNSLATLAVVSILIFGASAHDDELSPARRASLRVGGRASSSKRFVDEVSVTAVVLAPSTTEGPYAAALSDYADDSNMTAAAVADDRRAVLDGVPLRLTFNVYDVVGNVGTELANATVFVWHCDTKGVYGAVSLSQNPTNKEDTVGKKWLRSAQRTDANGVVSFNTIIPGWYGGRTLHFHVRVRLPSAASETTYAITTQLMFRDTVQADLTSIAPYSTVTTAYVKLAQDMIYTQASASVGDGLLLNLVGNSTAGFAATFALGIDRSATQAPGGMMMPPGGGGMPPSRSSSASSIASSTAAAVTTGGSSSSSSSSGGSTVSTAALSSSASHLATVTATMTMGVWLSLCI